MNKNNQNDLKTTVAPIYELTQNPTFDKIKVDIIKEAIKSQKYQINSKIIANKILEFAKEAVAELDETRV
jgi:anti-sigma28 factor (negative regulator of flagellin synthesis)